MPARSEWLSHQIAEFLGAVSSYPDEASAIDGAVERAAQGRAGLPGDALWLEITESVLMEEVAGRPRPGSEPQRGGRGVERDEQVRELRRLGCDAVQGFLLGRPVPAEAFCQWTAPNLDGLPILVA